LSLSSAFQLASPHTSHAAAAFHHPRITDRHGRTALATSPAPSSTTAAAAAAEPPPPDGGTTLSRRRRYSPSSTSMNLNPDVFEEEVLQRLRADRALWREEVQRARG